MLKMMMLKYVSLMLLRLSVVRNIQTKVFTTTLLYLKSIDQLTLVNTSNWPVHHAWTLSFRINLLLLVGVKLRLPILIRVRWHRFMRDDIDSNNNSKSNGPKIHLFHIPLSLLIQKVQKNLVPFNICKSEHPPTPELEEGISNRTHLCAGSNQGGRDTCAVINSANAINSWSQIKILIEGIWWRTFAEHWT